MADTPTYLDVETNDEDVRCCVCMGCICTEDSCDEWDPYDYPEGCRHCAALDPEMPCPKEPT